MIDSLNALFNLYKLKWSFIYHCSFITQAFQYNDGNDRLCIKHITHSFKSKFKIKGNVYPLF